MKTFVSCSTEASKNLTVKKFRALDLRTVFILEGEPLDTILNRLLADEPEMSLVCLVKESVTLPIDFSSHVKKMVTELNKDWPNWSLVGESGLTALGYGIGAANWIQFGSDNSRGPNLAGHILPSYGLSGNVLIINLDQLREKNFWFDKVIDPTGVTLPIQILRKGLAVLVAPQLSCFVNIDRIVNLESEFEPDENLKSYLVHHVSNLFLQTCFGKINLADRSDADWEEDRIDLPTQSLRNAQVGRSRRSLEIVTRTKFERRVSLQRTMLTVSLLQSRISDLDIGHTVISGRSHPVDEEFPPGVKVLVIPGLESGEEKDDRFKLITSAVDSSNTDYIWFIDDDDWVFPQCAEVLSLVLNTSPEGSTFYFDSQFFNQKKEEFETNQDEYSKLDIGARSLGSTFALNLSGLNHVPFCNIVFDRQKLTAIPSHLVETLHLYEDFAIQIMVMSDRQYFPVSLNILVAGIQMRTELHSNSTESRDAWNNDMATLMSYFVQRKSETLLFSLPEAGRVWHNSHFPNEVARTAALVQQVEENQKNIDQQNIEIGLLRNDLNQTLQNHSTAAKSHENALLVIQSMRESHSWKITRPMRVLRRFFMKTKEDGKE